MTTDEQYQQLHGDYLSLQAALQRAEDTVKRMNRWFYFKSTGDEEIDARNKKDFSEVCGMVDAVIQNANTPPPPAKSSDGALEEARQAVVDAAVNWRANLSDVEAFQELKQAVQRLEEVQGGQDVGGVSK